MILSQYPVFKFRPTLIRTIRNDVIKHIKDVRVIDINNHNGKRVGLARNLRLDGENWYGIITLDTLDVKVYDSIVYNNGLSLLTYYGGFKETIGEGRHLIQIFLLPSIN